MASFQGVWLLLLCLSVEVIGEDYYKLLGITRSANTREIRKAFKKLALVLHPDKNKDDAEAHEKFVQVNKAYEILKDDETRKKYDQFGEEGLKDNFGSGWRGNFHSWNYYHESFGIYDDDPEIFTLSSNDYDRHVKDSSSIWFINFYSPQCSHCHHLAPAWRQMARELEGVVRIGAVNCGDEWHLCRRLGINSYPSLLIFPEREKYQGARDTQSLVDFILDRMPNPVVQLTEQNLKSYVQSPAPWFIWFCRINEDCWDKEKILKISIIMKGLVNVGEIDCNQQKELCKKLGGTSHSKRMLFRDLAKSDERQDVSGEEMKEIVESLLKLLPDVPEVKAESLQELKEKMKSVQTWLIAFVDDSFSSDGEESDVDKELKRLAPLLISVELARFDCRSSRLCKELHLHQFPTFLLFRSSGSHEVYHGRPIAHDLASFVKEAIESRVQTLGPGDFPGRVIDSGEPWFIDFFAPWCPPCLNLLPEWRKASQAVGHLVNFGTVDCTIHSSLCNEFNIRSYPTTILYNQTVPHRFHGSHSASELVEFVQDTISPTVMELTPDLFYALVEGKSSSEMWAIDFFLPWCTPCQQLSPQWRKMAKLLREDTRIHVGEINCQKFQELCEMNSVHSYPHIRLYTMESEGTSSFSVFNGWSRDARSMHSWVISHLPSIVAELGKNKFFDEVLPSEEPWVIDFYAPWCGHCQIFAPEFEKVAQKLEGKVNFGKVNCEQNREICKKSQIRGYPTVAFFKGSKDGKTQTPWGEEIDSQNPEVILRYVEGMLPPVRKGEERQKDEL